MSRTTLSYSSGRNPIVSILKDGLVIHKILCIGDPHLGRVFKTGVPSNRLGEREILQYEALKLLLNPTDPLIKDIVIMGDLFDRFIVSPTVVLETFKLLRDAYDNNPDVRYSLIPGNHDLSKDTTRKSSYEILYYLFFDNILMSERFEMCLHTPRYLTVDYANGELHTILLLDAYTPFIERRMSYYDVSADVFSEADNIISFGHWDSLEILESGYTPAQDWLDNCDLIVSGHEHTPREYYYPYDTNRTPVLFTGSLQPYSHAEDPLKEIYITVDQDDLESYTEDHFKNMCLRIHCDSSFILSKPINCLALSYIIKEPDTVQLTEEELQTLDNSYQLKLASFLEQDESEFAKELKSIFLNKEFLDASN